MYEKYVGQLENGNKNKTMSFCRNLSLYWLLISIINKHAFFLYLPFSISTGRTKKDGFASAKQLLGFLEKGRRQYYFLRNKRF
jgi:hypothetical protein